jgi:3'-5' exonuclease
MQKINFNTLLFIDVETIAQHSDYELLDERGRELWNKKAALLKKTTEDDTPSTLYERAGIYAEFGRIVCISVGHLSVKNNERSFRLKSYYGNDEKELINGFFDMLNASSTTYTLCAHNGKEFDFAYIGRRALVHQLALPNELQLQNKKPWDIPHLDTMELWRMGDYKAYTSLELLAYSLSIATPKTDMDGSQVNATYWIDNNLQKIMNYCQRDVLTVAQILLKMQCLPLINDSEIIYIT